MIYKTGDRVITPDGPGEITGIDLPESREWRYIVKLDTPKYEFTPAYFEKEIKAPNRGKL